MAKPAKSAAQRRQELLNAQLGGPGRLGNQMFRALGVHVKDGRVLALSLRRKDYGPVAGAHAEVIPGKPAPRHGLVYQVVIGFQSGSGPTTVLITFPDGTYLEHTVPRTGLIDSPAAQAREVANARREAARFNQLAST